MSEPTWRPDADEPSWCVDATLAGCSLGERQASTMPASERRAIRLARARERAQAVLAQPDEPRERRVALLIGLSVGLHLLGFAALAWFGEGVEPRSARRGREVFTDERVIVPIEVPAREPPSEPEPSFEPAPSEPARPTTPARRRVEPRPSPEPSAPASYALPGFALSSQGTLPAGGHEGDAWGEAEGHGHGQAGGSATTPGSASASPDAQAKPRGSLVEPDYPPELERRGIEGEVVVLVWLDEHGHVLEAEVVEGSGYEAFDHNAEMAAKRQAWTPATRDGEPIASKRRYRIRFKLPTR